MFRPFTPPRMAPWLFPLLLSTFIFALQGCTSLRHSLWRPPLAPDGEIERNRFTVAKGEDVIGQLAEIRLEKGDTLAGIARHFGLGLNAVSAANPEVDIWVPKAGERILLPLNFILPDTPRKGIVVNLATMRLFHFQRDGAVLALSTYPVGIGTEEKPTPMGRMRVARKAARPTWYVPVSIAQAHRKKGDILPAAVPPGPDNPLGDYALYLSKQGYLIHGTNKPASIGLKATNGCMRLYPENIATLFRETPVNTPVLIINQPYLLGQRNGILYLEAHTPLEDSGVAELARINAKLRAMEKESGRTLDWQKIRQIQAEARGIPVPILALDPTKGAGAEKPVAIRHPGRLLGSPELPGLKLDAWYVLAAEVQDELDARRLAAIINHQGPPIPAQVLPAGKGHRVLAGPFKDAGEARKAVKRLKIDLELDGIMIEPVRKG